MSRVVRLEQEEVDEFPYVPTLRAKKRKTKIAKIPVPRKIPIEGYIAEAIRIYRCLMGASWDETAREFGCARTVAMSIVQGKYHNGRKRGERK